MTRTRSISTVAPIGLLGMALAAMLFFPIPMDNKDLINLILAGLLGFLSRGETAPSPPDPVTVPAGASSTVATVSTTTVAEPDK